MTAPQETVWEPAPHILAKHEILRRYLGAWFPILGSGNARIIYIDGFCGPGQYVGGEPGSPMIALREAEKHSQKLSSTQVVFLFIDGRQDRIAHLQGELAHRSYPANFVIRATAGPFETELRQILDDLSTRNLQMAPTFAFIDPFRFAGLPLSLVRRLLANPKAEVLVNGMTEHIDRFLADQDPQVTKNLVELFGTRAVLKVAQSAGDRTAALRQLYLEQLSECAAFVRSFEVRDLHNRTIYPLFFATNHPVGHVRIKEAFWKADRTGTFCFSDVTNADQPVLFEIDETPKLAGAIAGLFAGQTVTAQKVRTYVEDKTAFLASHMHAALRQLEEAGILAVEPQKTDGETRRAGTYPTGTILRFTGAARDSSL